MTPLLEVAGLTVRAATPRGTATILRGIDLAVGRGRLVGVVGESGSGKSTLAYATMRMLAPGLAATGRLALDGADLLALPAPAMRQMRGTRLAMIFQDPMTALNPLFTIGTQLVDVLRRRQPSLSRAAARTQAAAMLHQVGMPDAGDRLRSYPHELSGGMRQRVVIAMALLVRPDLLIADEPTTALDATVEAQIAALFVGLRTAMAGSVLFISHHLGLVAQICDDVCVMYGGTVVETGPVDAVVGRPTHPYTQALLACEITAGDTGRLLTIPGEVPDPVTAMTGCIFAARCPQVVAECRQAVPPLSLKAPGHRAACIRVPDA